MTRFCVYCGAEDNPDNPVVNGVCLRCRIKRGRLVYLTSNSIRADLCRVCGSVKVGSKWVEAADFPDAVDKVVKFYAGKILRVDPSVEKAEITSIRLKTGPSWRTLVDVIVEGVYGGKRFRVEKELTVFLSPAKCPRCIMYDSREFSAVVQIRGFKRELVEKAVSSILSKDHRLTRELVEAIETKDGANLYFYSAGAARKLARRVSVALGGKVFESHEDVGINRSGKRRSRLYISLKP